MSLTLFCLSETFDAKSVNTGSNWGENTVYVQNIPRLNRLTLCLWTKFPQTDGDSGRNSLVYYEDSTITRGFGFSIYIENERPHNGLFFIRADPQYVFIPYNSSINKNME